MVLAQMPMAADLTVNSGGRYRILIAERAHNANGYLLLSESGFMAPRFKLLDEESYSEPRFNLLVERKASARPPAQSTERPSLWTRMVQGSADRAKARADRTNSQAKQARSRADIMASKAKHSAARTAFHQAEKARKAAGAFTFGERVRRMAKKGFKSLLGHRTKKWEKNHEDQIAFHTNAINTKSQEVADHRAKAKDKSLSASDRAFHREARDRKKAQIRDHHDARNASNRALATGGAGYYPLRRGLVGGTLHYGLGKPWGVIKWVKKNIWAKRKAKPRSIAGKADFDGLHSGAQKTITDIAAKAHRTASIDPSNLNAKGELTPDAAKSVQNKVKDEVLKNHHVDLGPEALQHAHGLGQETHKSGAEARYGALDPKVHDTMRQAIDIAHKTAGPNATRNQVHAAIKMMVKHRHPGVDVDPHEMDHARALHAGGAPSTPTASTTPPSSPSAGHGAPATGTPSHTEPSVVATPPAPEPAAEPEAPAVEHPGQGDLFKTPTPKATGPGQGTLFKGVSGDQPAAEPEKSVGDQPAATEHPGQGDLFKQGAQPEPKAAPAPPPAPEAGAGAAQQTKGAEPAPSAPAPETAPKAETPAPAAGAEPAKPAAGVQSSTAGSGGTETPGSEKPTRRKGRPGPQHDYLRLPEKLQDVVHAHFMSAHAKRVAAGGKPVEELSDAEHNDAAREAADELHQKTGLNLPPWLAKRLFINAGIEGTTDRDAPRLGELGYNPGGPGDEGGVPSDVKKALAKHGKTLAGGTAPPAAATPPADAKPPAAPAPAADSKAETPPAPAAGGAPPPAAEGGTKKGGRKKPAGQPAAGGGKKRGGKAAKQSELFPSGGEATPAPAQPAPPATSPEPLIEPGPAAVDWGRPPSSEEPAQEAPQAAATATATGKKAGSAGKTAAKAEKPAAAAGGGGGGGGGAPLGDPSLSTPRPQGGTCGPGKRPGGNRNACYPKGQTGHDPGPMGKNKKDGDQGESLNLFRNRRLRLLTL